MTVPDFPEALSPVDAYSLEAVVTALYKGLLGRPPDTEGLRHHVEKVRTDGLAYVVNGIARSDEALARLGLPIEASQADTLQEQEARPGPRDEQVESYLAAWD